MNVTFDDKSQDPNLAENDPRRSLTAVDVNQIKAAVNSKTDIGHTHPISEVSGLQSALNGKQNAEPGKGLSEANFTDSEKSKLAGLNEYFKGTYTSIAALQAAYPSGQTGWEAIVDAGSGQNAQKYIWDNSDNQWILATGLGASSFAEISGSPNDNAALAGALALKENNTNKATNFNTKNDTLYPTTKAVDDAYESKVLNIDNLDADFTPAATDLCRWKRFTGSVARTITLPSDASVNLPVGFTFPFSQSGTGAVQWVAGSGATVNAAETSTKLRSRYSAAQAVKVAANTWLVIGDITV